GWPRGGMSHPGARRGLPRQLRRVPCRSASRLHSSASRQVGQASEARVKFLRDTDTCIYAIKQDASVLRRLLSESRADIAVSVITEGELRTGAAKSWNADKTRRRVENFLRPRGGIRRVVDD